MVKAFNARIAVVPDSMLARLGGLKPFAFFEAKGLEREVVVVDFGAPVMDEDADEDEGELDDKSHQRRSITPSTASGWE